MGARFDAFKEGFKATKTRMGNAALLTTGAVALGSYLAFSKKGTPFHPDDVPIQPIPPMLTPQDLLSASASMPQLENGPVPGRDPTYWRETVRPGQSQSRIQPMSAVERVEDLGAPALVQGV